MQLRIWKNCNKPIKLRKQLVTFRYNCKSATTKCFLNIRDLSQLAVIQKIFKKMEMYIEKTQVESDIKS